MNKTYIVRLTDDECQELVQLTKTGKAAAYKIKHAHILLQVDANGPHWADAHVANALHCHGNTVRNVRQRFAVHRASDGLADGRHLRATDRYRLGASDQAAA